MRYFYSAVSTDTYSYWLTAPGTFGKQTVVSTVINIMTRQWGSILSVTYNNKWSTFDNSLFSDICKFPDQTRSQTRWNKVYEQTNWTFISSSKDCFLDESMNREQWLPGRLLPKKLYGDTATKQSPNFLWANREASLLLHPQLRTVPNARSRITDYFRDERFEWTRERLGLCSPSASTKATNGTVMRNVYPVVGWTYDARMGRCQSPLWSLE